MCVAIPDETLLDSKDAKSESIESPFRLTIQIIQFAREIRVQEIIDRIPDMMENFLQSELKCAVESHCP